jgi:glucose-6-phosphate 1-epimerase
VVDATLSRACLNLQSAERKRHFFAALWLLQEGIVAAEDFKGSWAGAFGMTQFMPATFLAYMRDAPGGPVADIVHSVPDALATTARYLRALGWIDGLPWGVEVRVPEAAMSRSALEADHGCLAAGRPAGKCRSVAQWVGAGIGRVDGSSLMLPGPLGPGLPEATPAALLMPAGRDGPAWLVTPNYHAIWQYNRSDAYALAIGLLSDALRGLPPRQVDWPTDDPGISRAEFKEVQRLLVQRGHCDVKVDGFNGPLTVASIREEENRLGWPATGRAGARLLLRLRSDSATASSCLSGGPASSTASSPPVNAASAPPAVASAPSGS